VLFRKADKRFLEAILRQETYSLAQKGGKDQAGPFSSFVFFGFSDIHLCNCTVSLTVEENS
jgi:hypothetical protein